MNLLRRSQALSFETTDFVRNLHGLEELNMEFNNNGFLPIAAQKKAILAAGLDITSHDFVDNIPRTISIGPGEVVTVGIYLKNVDQEPVDEKLTNNLLKGFSKIIGVRSKGNKADFQLTLVSLLNAVKNVLWTHGERYVYITPELKDLLALPDSFSGISHEQGCFWGALNLSAQLSFNDAEILASDKLSSNVVSAGIEFLSAILANPEWLPTVNISPVPFAYVLHGCTVESVGESDKKRYLYVKYGYGNIEIGVDDGGRDFGSLVSYPTWEQFHI
jgi:hypothetical protein